MSHSSNSSDINDSSNNSSSVSTPTNGGSKSNLKSKQRVRFPADINPLSTFHYPNDDEIDPKSGDSQKRKPSSSPLASPPIVVVHDERGVTGPSTTSTSSTQEPRPIPASSPSFSGIYATSDYFNLKPSDTPLGPYKHRDSEVLQMTTLANTLYNRQSNPQLNDEFERGEDNSDASDTEPASRQSFDSRAGLISVPAPPETAITTSSNPLSHILDIGSYTSGGLAPGAVNYEEKNHNLPHQQQPHSNNSVSGSPYIYGEHINGDIPLLNLDRKLQVLKEQTDALEAAGEAETLVRNHTIRDGRPLKHTHTDSSEYTVPNSNYLTSATGGRSYETPNTPPADGTQTPRHEDYISPPSHLKLGVLGSLLKLYGDEKSSSSGTSSLPNSPPSASGSSTPSRPLSQTLSTRPIMKRFYSEDHPSKWYKHKQSSSSLADLVLTSSQTFAAPSIHTDISQGMPGKYKKRPPNSKKSKASKIAEQIRITVHIADVLQRQRFILRMCRALMMFGAPTHRLEEYMKMTSRVLEIDGQFLYIPGCMITSFGDPTTHTSEMHLVRCVQGLNLSKLHTVHQIYKEVVHDIIGVEEASTRLDDLVKSKNLYPRWLCIIFFGLAGASFALLSFGGRWPDFPISFILGSMVGFLQIWIAPRSDLYSNVFEVTSSILVSFLGRAFGSIGSKQDIFCFASIAQGSLALILPGYIILCGALELQSKNIVAGSVRMFYAVIYSCFGITLGATIYGWIDNNATSAVDCPAGGLSVWYKFLFLPTATGFIASVNQASIRQLPIMILISASGYVVTYFINKRLSGASQVSSAISAFVIGILGNVYSRVGHGLAFAAMLPGIFVIVPSGVASQGSLVAGIQVADDIVANRTELTNQQQSANYAMSLGITMIQVSIGITVGLFVATLFIYPFGKKRSGLFTF